MKFNPNDIFKNYPVIEDIAIRLEESEKQCKERNGKRSDVMAGAEISGKRAFEYCPEHAIISDFYKEGRWEQTPNTLKPGKEAFIRELAKILDTRDPDAIRIEIYKGKAKTKKSIPIFKQEVYFTNVPEKDKNNEEALHGAYDKKVEEARKSGSSELQMELLRKEFEYKLAEQRHQAEIDKLRKEIEERDKTIEELNEELDEAEGELNGIEEEKEASAAEILISRVLTQSAENLLKQNPKIMKIGLGLTDEDIKKIFDDDVPKLEEGKSSADSSSFSENKDDFAGLDEKHVQGIKELTGFFKQISAEEFRKLYTIDCILQDSQTGMLNKELSDKLLAWLGEEIKNKEEKPKNENQ